MASVEKNVTSQKGIPIHVIIEMEKMWGWILNNDKAKILKDNNQRCMIIYDFKEVPVRGKPVSYQYAVADYGTSPFDFFMSRCPDIHNIGKIYDHEKHVLICLAVGCNEENIVKIKMFDHQFKEIDFVSDEIKELSKKIIENSQKK